VVKNDDALAVMDPADISSAVVAPRHDIVVIGVFKRPADAAAAVQDLKAVGFSDEQIGFASPQPGTVPMLADDRQIGADPAEQGALAGAVAGVGVTGLLALGAVTGMVPVVGPVVLGGLFASILAGAATGGITGGLVGALIGLGVPERHAQRFEIRVRQGCTIVTVRAPGRSHEVNEILLRHGAMRNGGIIS